MLNFMVGGDLGNWLNIRESCGLVETSFFTTRVRIKLDISGLSLRLLCVGTTCSVCTYYLRGLFLKKSLWKSKKKNRTPVLRACCSLRPGRTLGIWDWCSLQGMPKMSWSRNGICSNCQKSKWPIVWRLEIQSLEVQMARSPAGQKSEGQKSKWPEI